MKTTTEHPFHVPARTIGLISHDGQLIEIASVCSTEAMTTIDQMAA